MDTITFKVYRVQLEGFKQVEPLSSNSNGRTLIFKEKELNDYLIIIQDAIPKPNFSIENMFKAFYFDYGNKGYKREVENE